MTLVTTSDHGPDHVGNFESLKATLSKELNQQWRSGWCFIWTHFILKCAFTVINECTSAVNNMASVLKREMSGYAL